MAGPEEDRLSEEELVAQMTIFLLAGTETTSSALTWILHLLALHPDVQDKLRNELKEAHENNDELSHDQLLSLPFLEAVCRETLRLYAPVPGVMRTTRRDVILPLSAAIQDVNGRKVHQIFVPENTNVFLHIHNLNRDPSIWGLDAVEWKPERWLAPLPQSVADANVQGIYANTMTFTGGACLHRIQNFTARNEGRVIADSSCLPICAFWSRDNLEIWFRRFSNGEGIS